MDQWSNKVAVVVGAHNPVGAEICRQLATHQVIIVGLTPHLDQLNVLGEEIREGNEESHFHAVQCDLAIEDEICRAVQYVCSDLGGVDILINCHLEETASPFLDDEDCGEAELVLRTRVLGLVSMTKKAYQSMADRDVGGHVVNICARTEDASTSCVLATGRAAVEKFTRDFGRECQLNRPRIRVSNICSDVRLGDAEVGECGRCVWPKDIADTVVYCLATPAHVQIKEIQVQVDAPGGGF